MPLQHTPRPSIVNSRLFGEACVTLAPVGCKACLFGVKLAYL